MLNSAAPICTRLNSWRGNAASTSPQTSWIMVSIVARLYARPAGAVARLVSLFPSGWNILKVTFRMAFSPLGKRFIYLTFPFRAKNDLFSLGTAVQLLVRGIPAGAEHVEKASLFQADFFPRLATSIPARIRSIRFADAAGAFTGATISGVFPACLASISLPRFSR